MKLNVIMALFASLMLSSFSWACLNSGPNQGHGDRYAKMADDLKFTPEQREQLKKIQDEYHKTLPEKHQAMDQAHDALEAALRESQSNDEVRKKFVELQKKQGDFASSRFEKILAIRAILTPEQRKMFQADDDKGKLEKK